MDEMMYICISKYMKTMGRPTGPTKTPEQILERKARNVLSAKKSRDRTKFMLDSLSERNAELEKEKAAIIAEFETYKKNTTKEKRRLEQQVKRCAEKANNNSAIIRNLKREAIANFQTQFEQLVGFDDGFDVGFDVGFDDDVVGI
jgi:membrane-bound lytic murein transglycosylase